MLHFVPLEARKRTLGALFFRRSRRLLALVSAVPLAASVIKRTALVAYGRCRIRADSIPTTILIPFDEKKSPRTLPGTSSGRFERNPI